MAQSLERDSGSGERDYGDWAGAMGDRWLAQVDRFESMISQVGAALLDHAGFAAGQSVVDIGCGGGETTLSIARAVLPGGRVLGLDVAPQLIALANQRMAALGAANARFQIADAQTSMPEGAPFDRAFSRFGVMFFHDTDAAFANIRTWLRPGGDFVFACWTEPQDNPGMVLGPRLAGRYLDRPAQDLDAPGPFRLHDGDATRAMLARAGFTDIDLTLWRGESLVGGMGADPVQAADFVMDGLGADAALAALGDGAAERLRAEVEAELARYYRDGAVRMPAAAWLVRARNPD